ncbi:TauD/TfdA family dioxygenase [Sphingomonas swuensis]|uniref:TauD/TfdA family dioxygenase n=1 Tax=Sphingomonas swuensis TaxID=977800 RepID=A0ABP7T2R7_9SPHN
MSAFTLSEPSPDLPLATIVGGADVPLDTLDPSQVGEHLRRYGALLVRGFATEVASFERFARTLCPISVFNESPDRETLSAETTVQTVNLGTDPFPLHPELSREPWRPDACLFACFAAPSSDGETTVCDGVGIVERLPAALVEQMKGRRLLYIQAAPPELLQHWLGTLTPDDTLLASPPASCPYWFRRVRGGIIRGFSRPLLHRPLFDDRICFGNFVLFARDYLHRPNFPCLDDGQPVPETWLGAIREAAATLTYAHRWQPGDVLVLDNSRFMHGRRAISDPRGRRIASYFGYLPFAPAQPEEGKDPFWRSRSFTPPTRERMRA